MKVGVFEMAAEHLHNVWWMTCRASVHYVVDVMVSTMTWMTWQAPEHNALDDAGV